MGINNTIILYHGNCLDGTGAMFAAWKKFGKTADYIPVQYGPNSVPDEVKNSSGKDIFLLDFSFPKQLILDLRKQHKRVTVIDHHKTAEADLKDLDDCVFNMDKSGAVLAWEYFHPGVEVPKILLHIQDRDLWNWKLPKTKEITTGINTLGGEPEVLEELINNSYFFQTVLDRGTTLVDYVDSKVDSATKPERVLRTTWEIDGNKYSVAMINSTGYSSEVCQQMYTKYPEIDIAVSYFIEVDGKVMLSLRSDKSKANAVNVAEIAKRFFDGGGHPSAAGGRTTINGLSQMYSDRFLNVREGK